MPSRLIPALSSAIWTAPSLPGMEPGSNQS
nr:MAG TPA: hypothetical protein [Caudoviricetes sp.]